MEDLPALEEVDELDELDDFVATTPWPRRRVLYIPRRFRQPYPTPRLRALYKLANEPDWLHNDVFTIVQTVRLLVHGQYDVLVRAVVAKPDTERWRLVLHVCIGFGYNDVALTLLERLPPTDALWADAIVFAFNAFNVPVVRYLARRMLANNQLDDAVYWLNCAIENHADALAWDMVTYARVPFGSVSLDRVDEIPLFLAWAPDPTPALFTPFWSTQCQELVTAHDWTQLGVPYAVESILAWYWVRSQPDLTWQGAFRDKLRFWGPSPLVVCFAPKFKCRCQINDGFPTPRCLMCSPYHVVHALLRTVLRPGTLAPALYEEVVDVFSRSVWVLPLVQYDCFRVEQLTASASSDHWAIAAFATHSTFTLSAYTVWQLRHHWPRDDDVCGTMLQRAELSWHTLHAWLPAPLTLLVLRYVSVSRE